MSSQSSPQSTPNLPFLKSDLKALTDQHPYIQPIVEAITKAGGRTFLVGGAVRDLVLGRTVYDLDIEVHGLALDALNHLLHNYGHVDLVGRTFGVLKLAGTATDWSLPRTDSVGRKPEVSIDPAMGIVEALRRRDVTMNAMAIDLATHEFIDPFQGLEAIKKKQLSSPDIQFFKEDPLRFYRVIQFVGRFVMEPDAVLTSECRKMSLAGVSLERIAGEYEKLLLKSVRPSLGLRWLDTVGRLSCELPELAKTKQIKQDPRWHPEGSVFEHSMQALDAAACIERGTPEQNLILRYAALCHDLGKASTTIIKDGKIKSPGHAAAGVPIARALLKRMTLHRKLIKTVELLVKYHMEPGQFMQGEAKPAAYKRLAKKLAPLTSLDMLAYLAQADRQGRNAEGEKPLRKVPDFINEFRMRADRAGVLYAPEEALVKGKDLLDVVAQGPEMGRILSLLYAQQLEEGISNKNELLELVPKLTRESSPNSS